MYTKKDIKIIQGGKEIKISEDTTIEKTSQGWKFESNDIDTNFNYDDNFSVTLINITGDETLENCRLRDTLTGKYFINNGFIFGPTVTLETIDIKVNLKN